MWQCSLASCAVMLHGPYWPTCRGQLHQGNLIPDSCRLQNAVPCLLHHCSAAWHQCRLAWLPEETEGTR